ncbi:uncharacterized protein LOC105786721 [Gossypium raimondii]|uniref:uncharacterized protein LOC105786721 n=1 Tax=Gossypium raimondii TaxID=29730 RepID=UPI00063A98E2|nr:uncharacterized protein LOC105786721 [Gossypium raimondii]
MLRVIIEVFDIVVKVDYNMTDEKCGRFARIVVAIDIDKPLRLWVGIDGVPQAIEYEGLPTICYDCGTYGHTHESWLKKAKEHETPEKNDVNVKKNGQKEAKNKDNDQIVKGIEGKSLYGPWMQAPSRRRRQPNSRKYGTKGKENVLENHGSQGSRFTTISNLEKEENHII